MCLKNLKETQHVQCLPSIKGLPMRKCRPLKKGEPIITPFYKGPKGGYYFMAKGVKVVPKDAIAYAKKKYGIGGPLKNKRV